MEVSSISAFRKSSAFRKGLVASDDLMIFLSLSSPIAVCFRGQSVLAIQSTSWISVRGQKSHAIHSGCQFSLSVLPPFASVVTLPLPSLLSPFNTFCHLFLFPTALILSPVQPPLHPQPSCCPDPHRSGVGARRLTWAFPPPASCCCFAPLCISSSHSSTSKAGRLAHTCICCLGEGRGSKVGGKPCNFLQSFQVALAREGGSEPL